MLTNKCGGGGFSRTCQYMHCKSLRSPVTQLVCGMLVWDRFCLFFTMQTWFLWSKATVYHHICTPVMHIAHVYSSCLPSAMDMLSSRVPLTLPPGCYQTGCHYTQIRQVLLALLSGSAYSQTVHRWQPSFTSCCSADLYFTTGQHCLGVNSTVIL